jgi:aminoglycoside phosphotransferase (APT) family kinase protein
MSDLRGLDQAAVSAWLAGNVAGLEPPLSFSVIAGGHSNITYCATDATGAEYVVRRGPRGRAGGGAHDMAREHRVISALAATDVPVPDALALCADVTIDGGPFFVMSRVEGSVLDNVHAADQHLPLRATRQRAGAQVVDVLARLHAVDIDAVGLGDAARRDGFLARQLRRFRSVWEQTATRDLPVMSTLADRLVELAPPQRYTGVVHGDYRIGNVMVDTEGTLVAVLDWELWTLGDVLADLGFLLNNWYEPADTIPQVFMEVAPTVTGEFGTRAEVLERYVRSTGFDVSAIDYYRGFQHWRMAVLAEGVKRRYETTSRATDVDFAHLDQRVVDLADLAQHHLSRYRSQLSPS